MARDCRDEVRVQVILLILQRVCTAVGATVAPGHGVVYRQCGVYEEVQKIVVR